ncbi:MAG: agmatinase [Candidatus Melainabacteria bacterium]|nr:agmatinase [Candidatus Melainabacteria bacterium]
MASAPDLSCADWALVGIPYDGTCTYRPGARFAPMAIREASYGLETYSPLLDAELGDATHFYDAGDLELPFGNRDACLERIYQAAQYVLQANKRWFGIGGEHLVTYPVIQAYLQHFPNLAVLHFDAHADLRADYMGEPLSHATVLRRVVEAMGPDGAQRLVQVGIRSGPRAEFEWMRQHDTLVPGLDKFPGYLSRIAHRPVFVTIDLDVLDPSVLPGTGTPEPGGMQYTELLEWLKAAQNLNVVGLDVVELSPHYDASGVSTAVATKVIRECLLNWPKTPTSPRSEANQQARSAQALLPTTG